jgi:NAD(P)-dependent dehydrogenase (short-subunit alcohol dehydrogenase family)
MTILDAFSPDAKVAIVTGAASGLGVAFATGYAEAGHRLVGARGLRAHRRLGTVGTQRILSLS